MKIDEVTPSHKMGFYSSYAWLANQWLTCFDKFFRQGAFKFLNQDRVFNRNARLLHQLVSFIGFLTLHNVLSLNLNIILYSLICLNIMKLIPILIVKTRVTFSPYDSYN